MFNSIDNVFLINTCNVLLKNLALEKICMLDKAVKNQESCIVNGRTTAKYFELGRGTYMSQRSNICLFIYFCSRSCIYI